MADKNINITHQEFDHVVNALREYERELKRYVDHEDLGEIREQNKAALASIQRVLRRLCAE